MPIPEKKMMTNKGYQYTELPSQLNGNSFACWITKNEGGALQVNIGQVKQVVRIVAFAFYKKPTAMIRLLLRLGEGQ